MKKIFLTAALLLTFSVSACSVSHKCGKCDGEHKKCESCDSCESCKKEKGGCLGRPAGESCSKDKSECTCGK